MVDHNERVLDLQADHQWRAFASMMRLGRSSVPKAKRRASYTPEWQTPHRYQSLRGAARQCGASERSLRSNPKDTDGRDAAHKSQTQMR